MSAGELLGPPHGHADEIAPSHRERVLSCCRLVAAFGLRREPEVLVSTLVFVERLLRVQPGLLLPCTLRPVFLTAFILALKTVNDEIPSGVMKAIGHAGLVHVDSGCLWKLEAAYLQAMAWNVSGCQTSPAVPPSRAWYSRRRDLRAGGRPIQRSRCSTWLSA